MVHVGVRREGLQSVYPSRYESDVDGFMKWTQRPRNKLYTERWFLKDWVPVVLNENENENKIEV